MSKLILAIIFLHFLLSESTTLFNDLPQKLKKEQLAFLNSDMPSFARQARELQLQTISVNPPFEIRGSDFIDKRNMGGNLAEQNQRENFFRNGERGLKEEWKSQKMTMQEKQKFGESQILTRRNSRGIFKVRKNQNNQQKDQSKDLQNKIRKIEANFKSKRNPNKSKIIRN